MAILEKITQMQQQGLTEPQMIKTLQEEGVSPREINEAIAQSKIKSAIASPATATMPEQTPGTEAMQPSIMPTTTQTTAAVPEAYPATIPAAAPYPAQQEVYPAQQEAYPAQAYQQETYPAQQEAYPAEGYAQEAYAPQGDYYQQALDTETVRDISKQIVEEALNKTKDQIKEITKLKTELKFQIQNMDNRLIKIETTISQLQSDILKKMGNYGESISDISEEIKATQKSFSKMVSPIVDKKRGTKTITQKTTKTSTKNSAPSFEDYFR